MSDFDDGNGLEVPPKSPQSLRTRIAAAIESVRIQRDGDAAFMADAVIRELEADVMADDYVPPCCRPGGRCNRMDNNR